MRNSAIVKKSALMVVEEPKMAFEESFEQLKIPITKKKRALNLT